MQEYTYKGCYTYLYTDQDSYEPLAQVFDNAKDGKQYLAYFHNDQIGIPKEMTDIHGNLLWYGEYTAWGRLKKDERVYKNAHQPFRLQNQYFDEETGLHYNLMRYYEPEAGRFVNQDPIGLLGGANSYIYSQNVQRWIDPLGLAKRSANKKGSNRNRNDARGEYELYEILESDKPNAEILKIGKAKSEDVMADGTTNRRAHTSARKARGVLGADGKALYPDAIHRTRKKLGCTTTGEAKEEEARIVRKLRREGKTLPLNRERDRKYRVDYEEPN